MGAGFLKCGGEFEEVGRTATAQGSYGIELFFGNQMVLAKGPKYILNDRCMVLLEWV